MAQASLARMVTDLLTSPEFQWSLFLVPMSLAVAESLRPVALPEVAMPPRPASYQDLLARWQAATSRQMAALRSNLEQQAASLARSGFGNLPTQAAVNAAIAPVAAVAPTQAGFAALGDYARALDTWARATSDAMSLATERARSLQQLQQARLRNLLGALGTGLEAFGRMAEQYDTYPGTRRLTPGAQELLARLGIAGSTYSQ